MYLHLGDEVMAKNRQIIGVFDLDTATVTKATRDFLSDAQKKAPLPKFAKEFPSLSPAGRAAKPKSSFPFWAVHASELAASARNALLLVRCSST